MAQPRLSFFAFALILILISSPLALSKTLKRDGTVFALNQPFSLRSDPFRSDPNLINSLFFWLQ